MTDFERGVRAGIRNALAYLRDEDGFSTIAEESTDDLDHIETQATNEALWDEERASRAEHLELDSAGPRARVADLPSDHEIERLRAVLGNAPHYIDSDGWWCQAGNGDACTCWKAEVRA